MMCMAYIFGINTINLKNIIFQMFLSIDNIILLFYINTIYYVL